MNAIDVDFSLDMGRTTRRSIQQSFFSYCEQLLEIALILTYESGRFLRRLWERTGKEVSFNKQLRTEDNGDGGWITRNRQYQTHNPRMSAQRRSSGGEGDFIRREDKVSIRLPRLVSVVCGFAKDRITHSQYNRGKFGEDAWFMTSNSMSHTLGVADGVGGWRSYGVDPGEFSMFLMRSCEQLSCAKDYKPERPDLLLGRAYGVLLEQTCPVVGSCTACILTLNRANSTLYTANIGDSGFLVVRSGAVVCRSVEQQHHFNTPYQLSSPPPGHDLNVLSDGPESADLIEFPTQLGDVIILATDGVYDNVPEGFLVEILNEMSGVSDPVRLQMTANAVALMARTLSFNPNHDSPFSQNARKLNIDASGGKPDDITVILATVV
ncbi:protein phosphatase PTC7 homolog [Drosophila ficusphila]|uniref:protein phosphatase PTC7 homolog n=1 Tax=Drosophila ficusphila TaxID=30025 RepID=UPI0007E6D751|nr:protein phosphatase PTC7 homolog [Drosophila ficusphila]